MFAPGTVFGGRYRIERALAKGGMGIVYEAVHLETERTRALKVMHESAVESPELRERFRREARVTSRVESEFIVEVFDAGVDDATGVPFLVMELLRGEELGQLLRRRGRFAPPDVATYLTQVGRALDKTHAASIVHRDLKPANLFLSTREDGSPRVKVLDFGIAKLLADGDSQGTQSLGTPLYMAPEQLRAQGRVTAAADVYALGLVAYTLLVAVPYWEAERLSAGGLVAFAVLASNGPTASPVARAAEAGVILPAAFDAWFFRATALEPEARWPSAGHAAAALVDALAVGDVLHVPPPSSSSFVARGAAVELASREGKVASERAPTPHVSRDGFAELTATDVSVTQRMVPPAPRQRNAGIAFFVGVALVLGSAVVVFARRGGSSGQATASSAAVIPSAPSDTGESASGVAGGTGVAAREVASEAARPSAAPLYDSRIGLAPVPSASAARARKPEATRRGGSAAPASVAPSTKATSIYARD